MTLNIVHAAVISFVVFGGMMLAYQRGQAARVPHDDTKLMETLKRQDETIQFQADTIQKQGAVMQLQSKTLREQSEILSRSVFTRSATERKEP